MPSAEAPPLVSGCLTLCSLVPESLFIYFLMPFYKVSAIMTFFEEKKSPLPVLVQRPSSLWKKWKVIKKIGILIDKKVIR